MGKCDYDIKKLPTNHLSLSKYGQSTLGGGNTPREVWRPAVLVFYFHVFICREAFHNGTPRLFLMAFIFHHSHIAFLMVYRIQAEPKKVFLFRISKKQSLQLLGEMDTG